MASAVARPRKSKAALLMEAQRALEMHLAGKPDVYICAELRISTSTLKRRIRWAAAQVIDPTVEEFRAESSARIRMYRLRALEELTKPGRTLIDPETGETVDVPAADPSQVAALLGRLTALEEREAKLRGADVPVVTRTEVIVKSAFEQLVEELNREVGAAKAAAPS